MAIYWPIANGNWSTLSNWASSDGIVSGVAVVLPSNTDDVFANNRTIFVDGNFQIATLNNFSTLFTFGTVQNGGRFILNDNSSLSATSFNPTHASVLVQFLSASPSAATLVGTVSSRFLTAVSNYAPYCINNGSTGTLNIYGNIFGASSLYAPAGGTNDFNQILIDRGGIINLYGNIFTPLSARYNTCVGIGKGTFNLYGNAFGGSQPRFSGLPFDPISNFIFNIYYTTDATLLDLPDPVVNIFGSVSAIGNTVNSGSHLINITSPCTLFILGSAFGGPEAQASRLINVLFNYRTVNIFVSGAIVGGTSSANVSLAGPVVNLSAGLIVGGSSTAPVVENNGSNIFVYGTVLGGSGGSGLRNNSQSNTYIYGDCIGGTGANAVTNTTDGTRGAIFIKKAIGNDFGRGSTGIAAAVGVSNQSVFNLVFVEQIQTGIRGHNATGGNIYLWRSKDNQASYFSLLSSVFHTPFRDISGSSNYSTTLSGITGFNLLFSSLSGESNTLLPSVSNVRDRVVYDFNNRVGTIKIPDPLTVTIGVSTDSVLGLAINDPSLVWSAKLSTLTALNTLGYRVKNSITMQNFGTLGTQFK